MDQSATTGRKHAGLADFFVRLVKEKPLGAVGAVITLLLFFTGIFADSLAPYGMNAVNADDRLLASSAKYFLGTDNLGRDLLSRIIFGARISVIVGLATASISLVVALTIGVLSGYIGGKLDLILQRFIDGIMSFPGIVLLMIVMSIVGVGMLPLIIVVGILMGIGASRIIRSGVINIREDVYIQAAIAIGCPKHRILSRHIVPNVLPLIITVFTIQVPEAIIIEASLSFLGFGVPPPTPSWGGMLSGSGRSYMIQAPWMALWPGLALAMCVYGINMFGDALRDLLDPRLRGGQGSFGFVKK
jgi:peptide/nickel transport system permease protein